jgi:Tetratricopeptide repeat
MRRHPQQYVLVALLSTAVVHSLALPAAYAQTSDERRNDARTLFKAGVMLQKSGDFAKALEKFQEAQRLYPAPTILLKIAQCHASLGKLRESAEAYRTLERMPKQDSWSPEFVLAQEQGRTELEQVELRTPRLTVKLDPQPPGAKLLIDNQQIDAAFIGVAYPVNPGTHAVVAFAPNYETSEQTVSLKEKDALTVTMLLTMPSVIPPKPPEARPETPAPKPPPSSQSVKAAAPSTEANSAIMIGAGGTLALPINVPGVFGSSLAAGLEVNAGLRFGKIAVLGQYEGMIVAKKSDASTQAHYAGLLLGHLAYVDKSSSWFAGGLGYRAIDEGTLSALDARIELGYAVHASRGLRVVPKGVLTVGGFSGSSKVYGFLGFSVGLQYDAIALNK